MERLIASQITWSKFFMIALIILALYFILQFLVKILSGISFIRQWQLSLTRTLNSLLTIYEPVAITILFCAFIFINPAFHGLLFAIFLLAGFTHFKNYLSGRIVHMDNKIATGKKLRTSKIQGIISRLGKLGIDLQTKDGVHNIGYSKLLADGYTLISGDEIGGFYRLRITPTETEGKDRHTVRIMDLFCTAPYLDRNHKPKLIVEDDREDIDARIVLREENHLHELIRLIKEWGYHCQLVKES